jgi:glycosyltransferase involved in cell wall biosynthesis
MAVWNSARFLAPAVESVLEQTYGDFELIAVNDKSDDGSEELLADYARQDTRVVLINNTSRLGVPATRNIALEAARGKYVAIMDADDISTSNRFEVQVKTLEEHRELVAAGSDVALIDPFGKEIRKHVVMPRSHDEIDQSLLSCGWPIVHPSFMARTEAMRLIGGYRLQYAGGSDHDLFLRMSEVGKLTNLPVVLLRYRLHLHNISLRMPGLLDQMVADAAARRGIALPVKRSGPTLLGTNFIFDSATKLKRIQWAFLDMLSFDRQRMSKVLSALGELAVSRLQSSWTKTN